MSDFSQKNQTGGGDADSFGKKQEDIFKGAQNGSLNADLESSLNMTISKICQGVGKTMETINQELEKNEQAKKNQKSSRQSNQTKVVYGQTTYTKKQYSGSRNQTTARNTKIKPVCSPPKSGTAMQVLGWVFTALFGILEFVFGIALGIDGSPVFGFQMLLYLPGFLTGLGLLIAGFRRSGRLKRFKKYVRELQGRPFGRIRDMARAIGKSPEYTVKDLQKMIADGVFPDGHLDDEETYLMVTREVFDDYLRADRIRKQKVAEADAAKKEAEKVEKSMAAMTEEQRQVQETVAEGRRYLEEIYQANEALPGEVISAKLDRLYDVTDRILYSVEQQPDKLGEIKQFMKYYLPTTLKLVKAYQEFENNSIQGSNILAAKEEIELSLDTINDGFEKLLDNLFEQDALDISTDIYVLQNMLAREGLADDPFADINQEEGSVLESNE